MRMHKHITRDWTQVSRISRIQERTEQKEEIIRKPRLNLGLPSPALTHSSRYGLLVLHLKVNGFDMLGFVSKYISN